MDGGKISRLFRPRMAGSASGVRLVPLNSIPVIDGYDATTQNESVLPTNVQAGGYDTGRNIAWTPEQYARHTHPYPAFHYDQDAGASDYQSDMLDVEAQAATDAEIVRWLTNSRQSFIDVSRPGQRWPGIYCSLNNVASAVTILVQAKLKNVPFIVADYNISRAEAIRRVSVAIGPYPAVGYQWSDRAFGGRADNLILAVPWLTFVSRKTPPPPPVLEVQEMLILRYTNPQGLVSTYTYDGTTLRHIMTNADQVAFGKVLPVVDVSLDQLKEFSGQI